MSLPWTWILGGAVVGAAGLAIAKRKPSDSGPTTLPNLYAYPPTASATKEPLPGFVPSIVTFACRLDRPDRFKQCVSLSLRTAKAHPSVRFLMFGAGAAYPPGDPMAIIGAEMADAMSGLGVDWVCVAARNFNAAQQVADVTTQMSGTFAQGVSPDMATWLSQGVASLTMDSMAAMWMPTTEVAMRMVIQAAISATPSPMKTGSQSSAGNLNDLSQTPLGHRSGASRSRVR